MTTLAPELAQQLTVGDPALIGALAVFPLTTETDPKLDYLSFAQAVQLGAAVQELSSGASVNDLLVVNPTNRAILLYEGEEVLGAQQNRTFDVSILVPASSRLKVPVSCVEAGRWDGARQREAFQPAPQTANPRLRQMKNAQATVSLTAGMEARAVQGEVWREVADTADRYGVSSATGAIHDVFEGHRTKLDEIATKVVLQDRQVGMLAAIGGRFVVLDHISQPQAFATLHGPLVQGYALDALAGTPAAAPSVDDAHDFIDLLLKGPSTESPAVGLGEALRVSFGGLSGAGLRCDGELVTITAFSDEQTHPAVAGRVRKPSQRRPGR